MKSEPRKLKPRISQYVVWMLLLLSCSLLQLKAIAQTAQSSNPIETYIAKNPDSPLVKYYLFNPADPTAAHAIKCAVVLDSPERANLDPKAIVRMENEVAEVTNVALKVEARVKEGANYERAAATMQAQMNAQGQKKAGSSNPASGAAESGSPTLSVPAEK